VDSDEDRGSTPLASILLILSFLCFDSGGSRNLNRNMSTEVHRKSAREYRNEVDKSDGSPWTLDTEAWVANTVGIQMPADFPLTAYNDEYIACHRRY
jgi:hypothetical protein